MICVIDDTSSDCILESLLIALALLQYPKLYHVCSYLCTTTMRGYDMVLQGRRDKTYLKKKVSASPPSRTLVCLGLRWSMKRHSCRLVLSGYRLTWGG
jgi:hypothetical protein